MGDVEERKKQAAEEEKIRAERAAERAALDAQEAREREAEEALRLGPQADADDDSEESEDDE